MADDARLSTALPRHPKTVKLKRRLGGDGCWSLVCLFLWVADNRPDGELAGLSVEDIEIAADWNGDQGGFVAALTAVGFLDGPDGSFSIHNWAEHNPFAATRGKRVEAAREANRIRWAREREAKGIRIESEPDRIRTKPESPPPHTTAPHTTIPPPDTASDVAGYVLDRMNLSGRDMRWLAEDAIKQAIKATGKEATAAAEYIAEEWDRYSAADLKFKKGKKAFLAEADFLPDATWRHSNERVSILDRI